MKLRQRVDVEPTRPGQFAGGLETEERFLGFRAGPAIRHTAEKSPLGQDHLRAAHGADLNFGRGVFVRGSRKNLLINNAGRSRHRLGSDLGRRRWRCSRGALILFVQGGHCFGGKRARRLQLVADLVTAQGGLGIGVELAVHGAGVIALALKRGLGRAHGIVGLCHGERQRERERREK